MSQITDITDAIQANITQVATQIAALATGIVALDALITAFQNSPGTLSPSDQTALNGVQTASAALVTQVKAISTAPPPTP